MLFPAGVVFATVGVPTMETNPALVGTTPVIKVATVATKVTTAKSLIEQTTQTLKTVAIHLKEFVGDALANTLAKAALRSITQSTVNWINNGFKGSPSFVTNPEGFLIDVADQTIGQAIEFAAPLLCSPFRLDIRAALGLGFSFGAEHKIRCRLTDVISNVQGSYDSFVGGNFASGGWNNWINITNTPQNNPYGAYLSTVDAVDARIITATGQEIKLLDYGRGFMSWRDCKVEGDRIAVTRRDGTAVKDASGNPITKKGPCKEKGPIKTPGAVLEGQLQNTLGIDLQSLGFADEINEVFAALLNQLVKKVFTSSGLAGASNYSNASYSTGTEITTTSAEMQADINTLRTITEGEGDNTRVNNTADTLRQRNSVVLGGIDRDTNTAVATYDAANPAGAGTQGYQGFVITNQNLAGNASGAPKTVRQSSVSDASLYGAEKGNDGTADSASVIETGNGSNPWWEVDLGQEYTIGTIKLYPKQGVGYSQYLGGSHIFLTNTPYDGNTPAFDQGTPVSIPNTDIGFIEMTLATKNVGRYLRVQRNTYGQLSFTELEVYQTETNPKPIPQITSLTGMLYNATSEESVNVRKGIVSADPVVLRSWQAAWPERRAVKGIDGNMNGNSKDNSGGSLVGILNPSWTPNGSGCRWDSWRNVFSAYGCAYTGVNLPWWEVDLGASKEIGEIKIWRITDIPSDDPRGISGPTYIFITETPYDPTKNPNINEGISLAPYITPPSVPEPRPYTIPINRKGRYVRIQKNITEKDFWFSELQVFEKPKQQSATTGGIPSGQTLLSAPNSPISVSPESDTAFGFNTQQSCNYNCQRLKQVDTEFKITNPGPSPVQFSVNNFITGTNLSFQSYMSSLDFQIVNSNGAPLTRHDWTMLNNGTYASNTATGIGEARRWANDKNFSTLAYTLAPSDFVIVKITMNAYTKAGEGGYGVQPLFVGNSKFVSEIKTGSSGTVSGKHEWAFAQQP